MGNTPSNSNGSAEASGQATPAGNASASSTTNPPTSTSSAPQPITSGASVAGRAPVFHSGLTPPARTPSPPPPSTPPLLPYAGHLSPQNPHALVLPQSHDYSKTIVTGLIMEAKLAPFYRGLDDFEEEWSEEEIAKILHELREKDIEDEVANSVTERIKEEKEGASGLGSVTKKMIHRKGDSRKEEEALEREKRERKAYIGAVECPICFLYYPSNINTSRCCQQPICTECFVQIKRGEATITHIESEPAACPFCVETDFGVIYERPTSAMTPSLPSAFATSPDAGTSGFSQALSVSVQSDDLDVGLGMAPKVQEKMRRKSVSSKAAEVVTIDQIRPDWERKLNAVKAAAARRASRRIVMRQVGDRLIPIGFTSARAPGTADFSMSTGAAAAGSEESGSRRSRRSTSAREREREMEEVMIMEAMRLSMIDHEDHQKKFNDQAKANSANANNASGTATPNSVNTPGQSGGSTTGGSSSRVTISGPAKPEKKEGTTSRFLSSIKNRSRSGSNASNKSVSFSAMPAPSRNSGSSSPTGSSPTVSKAPSNLKPTSASASPAVTTLADHRSLLDDDPVPQTSAVVGSGRGADSDFGPGMLPGIPRISLDMAPMEPTRPSMDMPPMAPTPAKTGSSHLEDREDVGDDRVDERPTYARLDSEM